MLYPTNDWYEGGWTQDSIDGYGRLDEGNEFG